MTKIFFILAVLLVGGCFSSREAVVKEVEYNCSERGVFRLFDTTKGCNFLLVLHSEKKLLVIDQLPDGVRVSDGLEVMVDYEIVEDIRSYCKAADEVVSISCMEVINYPEQECANEVTVFKRNWMRDAMNQFDPQEVSMYKTDSLNYFQLSGKRHFVFDCYGKMTCRGESSPSGTFCGDLLGSLREHGETIWTINY